ncbi:hypothetical protein B7P43_G12695 [Cryptotermes secundus]|uniref:Protein phosphatase 1 regulatory subunit 12B n=1 Tax=Cryptotermes secundus TaxID=105785 RepID=A0A2J7QEE5_9NEOP|nr:hypothetical protein B7P43_G12695 [Cryptotermes secundus]
MSNETRSNSALFKRAEQLKRWEESETNREAAVPNNKSRKVQFSAGCVFLAACAAGDKEEVLRLLEKGADIDTANVDGLTALHQACIDDNLEMVEFLVENGADVNRGDNEGWTPLHATASCGFISIAKYLIEHGGNVAAVNNDAELPLDIAESDEMEDMLQQNINAQGIDCDEARNEEERMMLEDAKEWLNNGGIEETPHPKTGATALHIAAAKGYIKVMSVLLQGGANLNSQDFDGWTPLHAAAHWGQKEACEMLVEEFCDMDMKNYVGQTAYDVADSEMFKLLEELKKKQVTAQKDRGDINSILQKKGASIPKRRSSITRMSVTDKSNLINKDTSSERQLLDQSITEEGSNKVKKVELEIETESEKEASIPPPEIEVEKKNRANKDEPSKIPTVPEVSKTVPNATPNSPSKTPGETEDINLPTWKRPGSFRSRGVDGRLDQPPNKSLSLRIGEKDYVSHRATTPTGADSRNIADTPEVVLRRTQSFEADEKRGTNDEAKITSCPSQEVPTTTTAATTTVTTTTAAIVTTTVTSSPAKTTATSPTTTSPLPTSQIRRSFVPPVRDEESETQRKAHAKRVRETRRSTQGVTLEEIKVAEQLVKKKNQQQLHQATQQLSNHEQFMLEDARNRNTVSENTSPYVRRLTGGTNTAVRPSSAPVENNIADATLTIPLRRQTKPPDDKEQDKENDIRNAQATQAVIQRRRRPKRRSTGVVHVDMDEINPDRQESPSRGDGDEIMKANNDESGGDLSSHSSRLSSVASSRGDISANVAKDGSENGEVDYKKLYEESLVENERLREKLKKTEEDLNDRKSQLDKLSVATAKNSLTEMEKRERRAMERKLSEMEEELKQLQKLKAENERLKAENRALTRVVSKLTNSANATK